MEKVKEKGELAETREQHGVLEFFVCDCVRVALLPNPSKRDDKQVGAYLIGRSSTYSSTSSGDSFSKLHVHFTFNEE